MKVGLDISRMHNLSKTRGIGYYAQNLFNSLKKYTDVDINLITDKADFKEYDLIHFPFFDLFKNTLPLKVATPFVVTIPDLIPLQFPAHYPAGLKGKASLFLQKLAVKNAKEIIAISNTVKEDIKDILKISPDKITTTYLAPSENYKKISDKKELEKIRNKYKLPDEFLLYVGNVNWNKNILNMAEASIKSGKILVIVGGAFLDKSNLDHPEKRQFKKFLKDYADTGSIKIIGFIEDEDLVKIMNLSTCLIFVSFYEGFGLPVLEAQSSGVPVITSNTSATKEISGKGAILVNPEDPQEIVNAITKIYTSKNEREVLIKAGFENAKNFSWEKTAKATVGVYEKCL